MAAAKGRAWKLERASVSQTGKSRPRSNKYGGADAGKAPPAGSRDRVWVGGYTKADGTKIDGYYRGAPGK